MRLPHATKVRTSAAAVGQTEAPNLVQAVDLDEARRRDRRWRIRRRRKLRSTLELAQRLPRWLSWYMFVLGWIVATKHLVLAHQQDALPRRLTPDEWLGAILSAPIVALIPALLTRSLAPPVGTLVRKNLLRRARREGLLHPDEDPHWARARH